MAIGALAVALVVDHRATPTVIAAAPSAVPASPASSPIPQPSPSPSPAAATAWGPTQEDLDRALADVQQLSVEEVAGQVIIAAVSSPSSSSARRLVTDYHLGGVIVMGDAVQDKEQLMALTGAVHEAMGERAWPAWVSVDHEGGPVARLDPVLPDMPAFMAAGAHGDKAAVRELYHALGEDIRDLGFTVNYAPVADATVGLDDPVIRVRSAGSDVLNVARTVEAAVLGFQDASLAATVKHFPGHGALTVDSHLDLPRYRGSLSDLEERDLVPFQAAVDAGVPVLMMGHIRVDVWGSGPASLEPQAYEYVREVLGFEGVVVTDALNMGAVTRSHGSAGATVAALHAGADIVLMPANVEQAHSAIVEAVRTGELSRARLDESAARMVALLRYLDSTDDGADVHGQNYASEMVTGGATVVAPLCGQDLVGESASVVGGSQADRRALEDALEALGVRVGSGTSVRLLSGPASWGSADVVVAMDAPWGWRDSTADAFVAVYGNGPEVMEGLAQVLTGQSQPRAVLPVRVPGLDYGACPSPR